MAPSSNVIDSPSRAVYRRITKSELQVTDAQRIVDAFFHKHIPITGFQPLGENLCSSQYLVVLRDTTKLVLKVAPPPNVRVLTHERDIIPSDCLVLQMIREQTNVPVPHVRLLDASCDLLHAPYT